MQESLDFRACEAQLANRRQPQDWLAEVGEIGSSNGGIEMCCAHPLPLRQGPKMACPDGGTTQLLCEQPGQRHGERFGNSRHYKQARVPFATFNTTDVRQVYLGVEGQLFLSDTPFLPDPPHVPAYDFAPILHCRIEHGGAYSL